MRIYYRILHIMLAIIMLAAVGAMSETRAAMIIEKESFGETPEGTAVEIYTLTNENGIVVKITNYEGIVVSVLVPNSQGTMADIVLGYDTLQNYIEYDPYFGGIQDKGAQRLNNVVWKVQEFKNAEGVGLELQTETQVAEDTEDILEVTVRYTLTNNNELQIDYAATADVDTHVNLTNDIYFNLAGAGSGNIFDHEILINGESYYPFDAQTMRPISEMQSVIGTPMNYREPRNIGTGIKQQEQEQVEAVRGYRHIWRIDAEPIDGEPLPLAARVYDPESGRVLEVRTSASGVWFETGNFMDKTTVGKDDVVYDAHVGFTLAAREVELSKRTIHFPSVPLMPGQRYSHTIIYKFFAM